MTTEISLQIDNSILLSLKEDKNDFKNHMVYHYAVHLYRAYKLSLGKAAELAGYSRLDFIDKLKSEGQPIFDYDNEMVKEMVDNADKTLRIIQGGQP